MQRILSCLTTFSAVVACLVAATACDNLGTSGAAEWSVAYDPGLPPRVDPGLLPFPNELYRGADGALALTATPETSATIREIGLPALVELGAFGPLQAVHFGLRRDGRLPGQRVEARHPDQITQAIHVVDIDPQSRAFGTTMTLETHLDLRSYLISAMPDIGLQWRHGGHYVAVVSDQVGAIVDGARTVADPAFARVRDGSPQGEFETRAAAQLDAALDIASEAVGIARKRIVAATTFRVQRPTDDLDAMAQTIYASAPATPKFDTQFWYGEGGKPLSDVFGEPTRDYPGRGEPGGIRHEGVAAVYTGTITAPRWAPFFDREPFVRDADGRPVTTETFELEWLVTVPSCDPPADGWPVVILQHGLGDNRIMALTMAESMSRECMATVAIDAVGHASRSRYPHDEEVNATGEPRPDGIGDGFPFGGLDQVFLLKPLVARDNLIETAAGLVYIGHAASKATWRAPAGAPHGVLPFDGTRIGYTGQSMGAIVGSLATGASRDIGAAVINVGGGDFMRIYAYGPAFNDFFFASGILNDDDPTRKVHRFLPALTLVQGALSGADPVVHGARWRRTPPDGAAAKHVLLQAARNDQLIANSASAALARAAGLRLAGFEAANAPIYNTVSAAVELPAPVLAPAPDGGDVAAAFVLFGPAEHGFITNRCSEVRWNHLPPYEAIEPKPVSNPTGTAQRQAARFVASALRDDVPQVLPAARGTYNPSDCD